MKILITGGAGYIGSHAVKLFLEKGYEVVVFDNLFRGYEEPLEILKKFGKLTFVKGDLRKENDLEKVFRKHKFEAVIHFAALCLVNESMEKPELYFENNVLGTLNLLKVMEKFKTRKIIFSSTCATYGETDGKAVSEKHLQIPANPYGESKLMAEKIIHWFGELKNFQYVILRYFNVCGAEKNGLIGDSKKPSQLLMQNAVRGAMEIENFSYTCAKVKTKDGTPIRDYIDVEDLVEAHFKAFEYLQKNGKSEILNLGNGKGYSVKEIVQKVEKTFKIKMNPRKGEVRKGEYAKFFPILKKPIKFLSGNLRKILKIVFLVLRNGMLIFPMVIEDRK
jgi:UDP-glucose 4-epimerase